MGLCPTHSNCVLLIMHLSFGPSQCVTADHLPAAVWYVSGPFPVYLLAEHTISLISPPFEKKYIWRNWQKRRGRGAPLISQNSHLSALSLWARLVGEQKGADQS